MEEDFPDWKPDLVKLESDLMPEDDLETYAHSPDRLMDDCHQNPAQTPPSAYRAEDSVFFYIKPEDNFVEGNNIVMEEPSQFDFIEANEERVKDPFHDVGCPVSTIATPPAILGTKTVSSRAGFEVESMGNALDGNNTCNETASALDFEFIKVETVSDLDSDNFDAEMETEVEPVLSQHAAFHAEVLSCPKVKSVDCTRVMDTNKNLIAHVSNQTNMGSSVFAVSSSDQHSLCGEKKLGRQSTEQSLSQKLLTKQSQRNFVHKKKLVSPSDARPFSCDQCSAKFSEKKNLKRHFLIHSDERAFSCDQCSATFSQRNHLKKHYLIHSGERAFSCDQCSASFKREDSLKRHSFVHSGERTFSCDQCPAKFSEKYKLKRHSIIHSGEKSFSCDRCPARFKMKAHLKEHSFVHSGEKAFSCDQCSAKFSRKHQLKTHLLVHSGEKPFRCDQCPAKFTRNSRLKIHSFVHSSKKVFP